MGGNRRVKPPCRSATQLSLRGAGAVGNLTGIASDDVLRRPVGATIASPPDSPHRIGTMTANDSRVTIHMAASLDGFIARTDGRVDWLETADEFTGGETMDASTAAAFLRTIDCYVMGSRTYAMALRFESEGFGWAYGDTPTFVLTTRALPRTRDTVTFHAGDLAQFVNERLRPSFKSIWIAGGGAVAAECLRRGLADEVRYSILPIVIGSGIAFFESLDRDVALHLTEVKAYTNGMVALRYEVQRAPLATPSLQTAPPLSPPSAAAPGPGTT